MALSNLTAIRTEVSDALGSGTRTASATITVSSDGTTVTSRVSVSTPANMLADELTDYQAFVDGLDELADALATGVAGLDS